jgi:hypothetical protein
MADNDEHFLPIVNLLLQYEADINSSDSYGKTRHHQFVLEHQTASFYTYKNANAIWR